MFKKWALRTAVFLGAVVGLFLMVAIALQVPAVGKTMGSTQACGTCHAMASEVATFQRSAHRDLSCLDCHSPRGFLEKPIDEVKTSYRHISVFVTDSTPDVIRPSDHARQTIQENCAACHAQLVSKVHVSDAGTGKFCFDCHRDTPHGRPVHNN